MNSVYQKFYKGFYMRTGGYIPSKPLNQNVYPGDFFQIRNGEMTILGNIFKAGIVDADKSNLGYGIKLNPVNWDFSDGVTKPYSGREVVSSLNIEDSSNELMHKLILAFNAKGSYVFKAKDSESIRILNWQDIQQELIIKLTQVLYSFREVYVVTESVVNSSWTLAVANSGDAEIEIATKEENSGLADIFGSAHFKTIQSRDIEYYHREEKRIAGFFKAKKLAVHSEKTEVLVSDLISQHSNKDTWANDFFDCDFYNNSSSFSSKFYGNIGTSVLDMLQANQLNPNTALQYFRWEDMNLDDIEKLFLTYEN